MNFSTRKVRSEDVAQITEIYRLAAGQPVGLARRASEVNPEFVRQLLHEISPTGLFMVIEQVQVLGFIHAIAAPIEDLRHVMAHLTVAIHPEFQGRGVGKVLFQAFLDQVQNHYPQIYRVELRARSSNAAALSLFRRLGFVEEGLFKSRIRRRDGQYEDGIPMAWFNPRWSPTVEAGAMP
jgi:ribosomal protein S18 acetylase RimI-like enzyme